MDQRLPALSSAFAAPRLLTFARYGCVHADANGRRSHDRPAGRYAPWGRVSPALEGSGPALPNK